jgi:hypothetical protein
MFSGYEPTTYKTKIVYRSNLFSQVFIGSKDGANTL